MSDIEWRMNHHYHLEDLAALYDQIPRRASCRRFLSAPGVRQWNSLCEAAGRLALPGTRLEPGLCGTDLFQPFGGLLMKFENVQRYVAVFTSDNPEGMVNAGISGELLMLEAVRLGMAGVWVCGTYKHKAVPAQPQPGERLAALIALGIPPESFTVGQRRRKPLQALTEGQGADGLFMDVLRAVQAAPSSLNGQPWRLRREADGAIFIRVSRPGSRLDLGIATAHALLALGNTPASFALSDDYLSVRMKPAL